MSKPMTATEFTQQLRKWGIQYEPIHSNWYSHNRNHKGEWGSVHGVIQHHTGSESQASIKDVLWAGYESLPGPLCHVGNDVNGKLWLVGYGRCNHAGLGDDDVLQRVIREDDTADLKPNEANTDGNRHFYGIENMYDGSHEMSPKQYKTAVLFSAAVCDFHNWTGKSVIGHGNWQPGKWDPGARRGKMMNMAIFQNHVDQALREGPRNKK